MNKIYFRSLFFIFSLLSLNSVMATELGDILTWDDGTIHYLTKMEATKHCDETGSRLPTFREYAEHAVFFGAKIRESNFRGFDANDPKAMPEIMQNMNQGYELQLATLPDGKREAIDYYYNSHEYNRPAEENVTACFWTSTPSNDYGRFAFKVFCNRDGSGRVAFESGSHLVRCIKKE